MNMMTISKSIGVILYEKGIIGHVTVDLVSFPDPTSPNSHPLFWAVDLNCGMTDYASACYFFDFLMVIMFLKLSRKGSLTNSLASISLKMSMTAQLNHLNTVQGWALKS